MPTNMPLVAQNINSWESETIASFHEIKSVKRHINVSNIVAEAFACVFKTSNNPADGPAKIDKKTF